MAKCDYCHREMTSPKTTRCAGNKIITFPGGTHLPSIKHVGDGKCRDCGVDVGEAHHPGCDKERCPMCKGQLISCPCLRSRKKI